jgi:hypothetical protein
MVTLVLGDVTDNQAAARTSAHSVGGDLYINADTTASLHVQTVTTGNLASTSNNIIFGDFTICGGTAQWH